MRIRLNERTREIDAGTSLHALRDRLDPEADLLILNGHPSPEDAPLEEGDTVVFIRRGRPPSRGELEALLTARHSPGVAGKVRAAAVGVAGLGGLGSALALALARTGIGELVLADFDVVEPSNLNRQQYSLGQLGQPKVEATAGNLRRVTTLVEFRLFSGRVTAGNAPEVFSGCDVVAECFDVAEEKAMLVNALAGRVPVVAASGVAGYGPANEISTREALPGVFVVGDGATAAEPGRGLMAPRVGVAAHHQANAVLRLILGCDPCRE